MELCLRSHRFYDKDDNRLTPWVNQYKQTYKVSTAFFNLHLMFKGYDEISKYAGYRNSSITNKTKNSLIDAFKR